MRNFDYSKLNSIKWDGEILNYISKIGEYKGRQELFLSQKPKVLDTLVELAIIQSTESSNKIEGISTTNTCLLYTSPSPRRDIRLPRCSIHNPRVLRIYTNYTRDNSAVSQRSI